MRSRTWRRTGTGRAVGNALVRAPSSSHDSQLRPNLPSRATKSPSARRRARHEQLHRGRLDLHAHGSQPEKLSAALNLAGHLSADAYPFTAGGPHAAILGVSSEEKLEQYSR